MADIAELGFKTDTSDLDDASKKLDKLTDSASKAERGSRSLSSGFSALAGAALKFAAPLAGLVSVAGIVSFVNQTAEAADEIGKLSIRLGITSDALQRLQFAASMSGASAATLTTSLQFLGRAVDETLGGSKEMAEAFSRLGITTSELQSLSIDQLFIRVADAISKTNDPTAKLGVGTRLLGRGFGELLPTLDEGAEGLRKLGDEAERAGAVLSDDLIKASTDFNDNLQILSTQVGALARQLAGPIIEALANITTGFIEAQRAGNGFWASLGAGLAKRDTAGQIEDLESRLAHLANELEKPRAFRVNPFTSTDEMRRDYDDVLGRLRTLREEAAKPVTPTGAIAGGISPPRPKSSGGKKSKELAEASDAALAFESAMQSLVQSQISAQLSTEDLDAAQTVLRELMLDPMWAQMPEPWRELIQAQTDSTSAAIRAAEEQAKLKSLLEATPTAQLEQVRQTMQFLADAFMAGKISAEQFNEAATAALGNTAKKAAEVNDSMKTFAEQAARNMQDSLAQFLFDPFDNGLEGMLNGFAATLRKMAAEAAAAQIFKSLGGAAGTGGIAGFLGDLIGGLSFDGGGFTGVGSRTGGIDGKGGFLATLHPNETVVDHTKNQSMPTTGIVNQTFNVVAPDPDAFRMSQRQIMRRARMGLAI